MNAKTNHRIPSMSKWFVGSSSNKTSGLQNKAHAKATRICANTKERWTNVNIYDNTYTHLPTTTQFFGRFLQITFFEANRSEDFLCLDHVARVGLQCCKLVQQCSVALRVVRAHTGLCVERQNSGAHSFPLTVRIQHCLQRCFVVTNCLLFNQNSLDRFGKTWKKKREDFSQSWKKQQNRKQCTKTKRKTNKPSISPVARCFKRVVLPQPFAPCKH